MQKKTADGSQAQMRTLQVPFRVDKNNKIVECMGVSAEVLATALEENCKALGGTYDHDRSKCILVQNCNNLVAGKPVSQLCLAHQMAELEKEIVKDVANIPKPTPYPKLQRGNVPTPFTPVAACTQGTEVSITNGKISCKRFSVGREVETSLEATPDKLQYYSSFYDANYEITDPAIVSWVIRNVEAKKK